MLLAPPPYTIWLYDFDNLTEYVELRKLSDSFTSQIEAGKKIFYAADKKLQQGSVPRIRYVETEYDKPQDGSLDPNVNYEQKFRIV